MTEEIDTGSDHRSVKLVLDRLGRPNRKRKIKGSKHKLDPQKYRNELLKVLPAPGCFEGADVTGKAKLIQKSMLEAQSQSQVASRIPSVNVANDVDVQLKVLIKARRQLNKELNMDEQAKTKDRATLSKKIQKLSRTRLRQQKRSKIEKILSEFRGLKQIAAIKSEGKREHIAKVADENGVDKTSPEEIAEAFARFYEKLYTSTRTLTHTCNPVEHPTSEIPPFSMTELLDALKRLKRGRSADTAGIAAELLLEGCAELLDLTLQLFNDVLQPSREAPTSWKHSCLITIFKKGDPSNVANYRPIAIIPVLYKLFSPMLTCRLSLFLMPRQSHDQAAYRKGYCTEHHLLTLTLVLEASREWNIPLWLCAVDFEKAFDTIEHDELWKTLLNQGVPSNYIDLLKKLYCNQEAEVQIEHARRCFNIERGVKQGDPLSSLLFLAVMEDCMAGLKDKWNALNSRRTGKTYGIVLDPAEEPLTNLRFADDLLLFAQSFADARKMLNQLTQRAARYGLRVNFEKTKMLPSSLCPHAGTNVRVGTFTVQVVARGDVEKYLGRVIAIDDFHLQADQVPDALWLGCFYAV